MILTVKSKTSTPILSVPTAFAALIDVTDSFYIYEISYTVDAAEAVKEKTFIVNINIDKNIGNQSTKPVLVKNVSNQQLISNLQIQAPLLKAAALSVPPYVLTLKSDITSRIPNNDNNRLLAVAAGAVVSTNMLMSAVRSYTTQNVGQVQTSGLQSPIMDLNLNVTLPNPSITINPQLTRVQSTALLYSGIDPASLTARSNTIVPTSKTHAGIIPVPSLTLTPAIRNNPIALNVVSSQLSNFKTSTVSSLAANMSVVTVSKALSSLITIVERVNIPVSRIGKNNFNVVFDLLTTNGVKYQTETRHVDHGINLTQLIPTEPPVVKQFSDGAIGKAVFEVKQVDPYAKGFFVYRRELNPNVAVRNAKYTQVAKQNLLPNETIFFEDRISTCNKVLYRFIPFADDDLPSTVFTSIVASFKNNSVIKKNHIDRRPVFAVLDLRMSNEQISINVSSYSDAAIGMRLKRRNLTTHEKEFILIASTMLTHSTVASIKFSDNNVKAGNIYEYKVDLIFPDGFIGTCPTNSIIEFSPITNNIAVTKVTDVKIGSYEGLPDVTFNIEYSLSETNFELIKKLFSEQKLSSEYQVEIAGNKEKLTTLLSYKVLRTNLSTGEIENFGIISDKSFSDRKYGLSRSVKDLDYSAEYVYTVITYVRNPETVLPKYERAVSSTVEGISTSYNLRPYKWLQPVTLAEGNLVTPRSLQSNHSKSELEQGLVVDIRYIPVAVSNILPVIDAATVSKVGNGKNSIFIEWKVLGDVEKIDHFIVILNIMGMKTIVGTAHAISANKSFVYVDPLTNGEQGQLDYTIIPVYYDYTKGKEFKTNSVIV